jgi:hypothetical protein
MQPSEQVSVVVQPVRGVLHLVIVLAVVAGSGLLLSSLADDVQLFLA